MYFYHFQLDPVMQPNVFDMLDVFVFPVNLFLKTIEQITNFLDETWRMLSRLFCFVFISRV